MRVTFDVASCLISAVQPGLPARYRAQHAYVILHQRGGIYVHELVRMLTEYKVPFVRKAQPADK